MIAKEHKTDDGRLLLVLCDADLLGRTFEEGKLQLDLSSSFYQGKEITEKNADILIKKAYLIHAVGEKTIAFLRKVHIRPENILRIQNIPHAQIIISEVEE